MDHYAHRSVRTRHGQQTSGSDPPLSNTRWPWPTGISRIRMLISRGRSFLTKGFAGGNSEVDANRSSWSELYLAERGRSGSPAISRAQSRPLTISNSSYVATRSYCYRIPTADTRSGVSKASRQPDQFLRTRTSCSNALLDRLPVRGNRLR
jgi:hypothetical protein